MGTFRFVVLSALLIVLFLIKCNMGSVMTERIINSEQADVLNLMRFMG